MLERRANKIGKKRISSVTGELIGTLCIDARMRTESRIERGGVSLLDKSVSQGKKDVGWTAASQYITSRGGASGRTAAWGLISRRN